MANGSGSNSGAGGTPAIPVPPVPSASVSGVGHVLDWGGFLAAVGLIIAGRGVAKSVAGWSANALTRANQRFGLWYHYSFTAHMRRYLVVAGVLNVVAAVLVFVYGMHTLPEAARGYPMMYWLIAELGLATAIFLRWVMLADVKRLSDPKLRLFLSTEQLKLDELVTRLRTEFSVTITRDRLVELIELTGLNREELRTLLEAESRGTIPKARFMTVLRLITKSDDDQVQALTDAFGKKGKLGIGTALLMVASYALNGTFTYGLASFATQEGALYEEVGFIMTAATVLIFLSLIAIAGTLAFIATLAKNVIAYAGAMFRGFWDSGFTALPGVTGNEAKELLPTVEPGVFWHFFRVVAGSLPAKFLIASIALFYMFPHPALWIFSIVVVTALGFGGLTSQTFGNDITESVKATGRFISFLALVIIFVRTCGFLTRIGFFAETFEWLDSNGVFYWWNRFAGIGYIAAALLLGLVAVAVWGIKKIPSEGKWLKRVRIGLFALCGLMLLPAFLGIAVGLTGADAYIGSHHGPTHSERVRELRELFGSMFRGSGSHSGSTRGLRTAATHQASVPVQAPPSPRRDTYDPCHPDRAPSFLAYQRRRGRCP